MTRLGGNNDPETYTKTLEFQAIIRFEAKTDEYGDAGIAAVFEALALSKPIVIDEFWDEKCAIIPTEVPRIISLARDVLLK